ncbi:MAG: FtsX-like permease family protein, partial [Natronosporangium sp.]
ALPWFAVPPLRRADVVAVRGEAALLRPSLRRLTLELTVLVLAGLGVLLLRRRGLFASGGTDPYLSAVPLLLGLAVALLALRLYPWPLRLLGRLAARLRGAVTFVGVARAGRTAPAVALPLVVLVVAISVGVFSGVLRDAVAEGRDRAAWWPLGGDVRVHGVAFDPGSGDALAGVPGVRAVAPMAVSSATQMSVAGDDIGIAVPVLAVDGPAYQKVLDAAGIDYRVPATLTGTRPSSSPVPVLLSARLADRITDHAAERAPGRDTDRPTGQPEGKLGLGSGSLAYRAAGVIERFPGLPLSAELFAVVPLQAVPADAGVLATDFAVAGAGTDPAKLADVASRRQYATVARISPAGAAGLQAPTLTTRADRVAAASSQLDRALALAFGAGLLGAGAIALLAVGFAIVVSARARGRMVSRLRTLGLPQRGARGLLLWEAVPLVGVAVLAGTGIGAVLPWLLGPALGVERFTGGAQPRFTLDPYAVGALAGLVLVVTVAALATEAAVNRRLDSGGVLRVGEDE